ncbi:MAG TPA: hypothetical protein VFO85_13170, partial [Vicinamibacteria bacterium]|nr:hypothetical protein [Vicinamibacteria bacterium]
DALTGRYVMYRNQYRNFGTHEAIVFNGTVDAGGQRAGVRWYEIRDPNGSPVLHQHGTYAPNDGVHRWMGSAAMDRMGNLAVGFSVSNDTTVFPGIRYAGRLVSDPLGQLAQGEAVMFEGAGIQSSTGSRWGDYSMMAVDPVDDCTFWYTTEYYLIISVNVWQTRIGRFRFPNCAASPDFLVNANPFSVSVPSGGSAPTTVTVRSVGGFANQVNLTCRSVATAGIACSYAPGSVTPPPNGAADTTLTLNVNSSVAPGTYWVMVVGTSGGVERSARVQVTVTAPAAPLTESRSAAQ